MARLPIPGSDENAWGSLLNDFLSQVHDTGGQLKANSVGTTQIQPNSITSVELNTAAITKNDVGLNHVDNTSDVNKPISTATQAALNAKADKVAPVKTMQIKVIDDTTVLATATGKAIVAVSADLNAFTLTGANAYVSTSSSSGTPTIQVRNITNGNAAMLSTAITIDANENTSYTAAVPAVINPTYAAVSTGQLLAIDISVAGTGATGLGVILQFTGA